MMQRQRSSAEQYIANKYFRNDNHLAVCGRKVAVYKCPKETVKQKYSLRHLHHAEPGTASKTDQGDKGKPETGEPYREHLQLKTANVRNSAVCSKQLKEIRESVEVEDFKRLLKRLNAGTGPQKKKQVKETVVGCIDANGIYEEFFQNHYDFLQNIATKN